MAPQLPPCALADHPLLLLLLAALAPLVLVALLILHTQARAAQARRHRRELDAAQLRLFHLLSVFRPGPGGADDGSGNNENDNVLVEAVPLEWLSALVASLWPTCLERLLAEVAIEGIEDALADVIAEATAAAEDASSSSSSSPTTTTTTRSTSPPPAFFRHLDGVRIESLTFGATPPAVSNCVARLKPGLISLEVDVRFRPTALQAVLALRTRARAVVGRLAVPPRTLRAEIDGAALSGRLRLDLHLTPDKFPGVRGVTYSFVEPPTELEVSVRPLRSKGAGWGAAAGATSTTATATQVVGGFNSAVLQANMADALGGLINARVAQVVARQLVGANRRYFDLARLARNRKAAAAEARMERAAEGGGGKGGGGGGVLRLTVQGVRFFGAGGGGDAGGAGQEEGAAGLLLLPRALYAVVRLGPGGGSSFVARTPVVFWSPEPPASAPRRLHPPPWAWTVDVPLPPGFAPDASSSKAVPPPPPLVFEVFDAKAISEPELLGHAELRKKELWLALDKAAVVEAASSPPPTSAAGAAAASAAATDTSPRGRRRAFPGPKYPPPPEAHLSLPLQLHQLESSSSEAGGRLFVLATYVPPRRKKAADVGVAAAAAGPASSSSPSPPAAVLSSPPLQQQQQQQQQMEQQQQPARSNNSSTSRPASASLLLFGASPPPPLPALAASALPPILSAAGGDGVDEKQGEVDDNGAASRTLPPPLLRSACSASRLRLWGASMRRGGGGLVVGGAAALSSSLPSMRAASASAVAAGAAAADGQPEVRRAAVAVADASATVVAVAASGNSNKPAVGQAEPLVLPPTSGAAMAVLMQAAALRRELDASQQEVRRLRGELAAAEGRGAGVGDGRAAQM